MRNIIFICAVSLTMHVAVLAAKLEEITIIVPSCDKYACLWDGCFGLLFKHWPSLTTENKDVKIILISNTKEYPDPRITTLKISNEQSWSNNMQQALKLVKTKYVFIWLEDYIMNQDVDEDKFVKFFNFMKEKKALYMQVFGIDYGRDNAEQQFDDPQFSLPILAFKKHSPYRTSLQACIFETDTLDWLLNPQESAWDFELTGSTRSEGMRDLFLGTKENLVSYYNAANAGVLNMKAVKYIQEQGFKFENIQLLLEKPFKIKWKEFKRSIHVSIRDNIRIPIKNAFKKIFK